MTAKKKNPKRALPIVLKRQKAFIKEYLLNNCFVNRACEKLGMSRQVYYIWKKENLEDGKGRTFTERLDSAIEERAMDLMDVVEEQDPKFILMALMPKVFNPKLQADVAKQELANQGMLNAVNAMPIVMANIVPETDD